MNDAVTMREVLDRLRNRFFGKYRGTVTRVDAATWSIKAQVPAVLGTTESGWCQPCVPYAGPNVGFLMLPEVGSGVWIEFEAGDVSRPIWVGCFWRAGELPGVADPDVKALVTQGGTLALDDNAGSVTLTEPQGGSLTLEASGITLDAGGSRIELSSSMVSVNNGGLTVS